MAPEAATHVAAPVTVADYTQRELIVPWLREQDAAGIINELSSALQRQGGMPDLLPFYQAALNQEMLAGSSLPCGLAFPHARLSGVKRLQFAFGRTPKPIIWGPKSAWRVQMVFLLAVPATDAAGYLHLLASLARLGQQSKLLTRLRTADNADDTLAVLDQIRLRQA